MAITIKFNQSNDENSRIVCDTNVWYQIVRGLFHPSDSDELNVTGLSLTELRTSKTMLNTPQMFQDVLYAIKNHSKGIISLNPFDFVLLNHDSSFPVDDSKTKAILIDFSKLLMLDIDPNIELDEDIKKQYFEDFEASRGVTKDFAEFATEKVHEIQDKLGDRVSRSEHLNEDSSEINKGMMIAIFKDYAQSKGYEINLEDFDWTNIDLFMKVTKVFFNKVETTPGMKVKPNDGVDWFNMLYVRPTDKYLTFEKTWRNYILNDEASANYLHT